MEDRLTPASVKQEISLAIEKSNDYGGIVLFIAATTDNKQTKSLAVLISQTMSENFNDKCRG